MMIVWRDIGFGIMEALARTRFAYSSGSIAMCFLVFFSFFLSWSMNAGGGNLGRTS